MKPYKPPTGEYPRDQYDQCDPAGLDDASNLLLWAFIVLIYRICEFLLVAILLLVGAWHCFHYFIDFLK
jgi:hypothetical protein